MKINGTKIRLHYSFILLAILIIGQSAIISNNWFIGIISGMIVMTILCTTLLAHELGHTEIAKVYGHEAKEIVFSGLGGYARIEGQISLREELIIVCGGPGVNIALAIVFGLLAYTLGINLLLVSNFREFGVSYVVAYIYWCNILMGGSNLIPAYPMDGGRILMCILLVYMTPKSAVAVATNITRIIAILFIIGGIYFNLMILSGIVGALILLSSIIQHRMELSANNVIKSGR